MPEPAPSDGVGRRLTRTDALYAAALAVLTAAVYAPCVGYGFVNYDDPEYAAANPRVLGGLSAANVGWAFETLATANWHPLTWLSLQLDATVSGDDPAGYHLTNVFLHAANTGLVYLVLVGMTGAAGRCLLVAALFGLHPLHVESVAWVSERKDVLSVFFGLLAVGAYARYARGPSWGRFLPVVACFALSLMAKPMLVTFPFALLLVDAWPLGRLRTLDDLPPLVKEKTPLFLLSALSCVVTFYAQVWGGAVRGLHETPLDDRLANVAVAYGVYLGKTFEPTDLAIFYPFRLSRPLWQSVAAGVLLAAVTALAVGLRKRSPAVLVGWLWFLGSLVPVIGLVHVGETAYADRYAYWPHAGLFVAVVWAAAGVANRLRIPHSLRLAAAVVVLVLCAVLTRQQLAHWRDSRALWGHAAALNPDAVYPRLMAAHAARAAGDTETALRFAEEILIQEPDNLDAAMLQAHILDRQGRWKSE